MMPTSGEWGGRPLKAAQAGGRKSLGFMNSAVRYICFDPVGNTSDFSWNHLICLGISLFYTLQELQ